MSDKYQSKKKKKKFKQSQRFKKSVMNTTDKAYSPKSKEVFAKAGHTHKGGLEKLLPFGSDGPCPHLHLCGACKLLPLPYSEQLLWKEKDLRTYLNSYPSLSPIKVEHSTQRARPFAYRHTVKPSIRPNPDQPQQIKIGLYQSKSHRLLDLQDCIVQSQAINHLLNHLRQLCPQVGLNAYQPGDERVEDQHSKLRYIVLRQGTEETLYLTLVVTYINWTILEKLKQKLLDYHPQLIGIAIHQHRLTGNAIFDYTQPTHQYWGQNFLKTSLKTTEASTEKLDLKISATSFAQVNPEVAQWAYQKVIAGLKPQGNEIVLDLYCGVGAIGLLLAHYLRENGKKLHKLYGLEETPSSIMDAKENAQQNEFTEVEFLQGRVEDNLSKLYADKLRYQSLPILVVLNPSRRGCQENVLKEIVNCNPSKIAYMSCHARTKTRDLNILHHLGYEAKTITLFDMFPGSPHYETVSILSRRHDA